MFNIRTDFCQNKTTLYQGDFARFYKKKFINEVSKTWACLERFNYSMVPRF
nr:MAG TPA: hypothetical protein [Caudoviricetes sp.]DAR72018.1 MAG TPA: hypothetical protein [Caudoviricetes sp.]DAX19890.1 MAG TPA: hypothetical protein [Caudoviricetes sp.]